MGTCRVNKWAVGLPLCGAVLTNGISRKRVKSFIRITGRGDLQPGLSAGDRRADDDRLTEAGMGMVSPQTTAADEKSPYVKVKKGILVNSYQGSAF